MIRALQMFPFLSQMPSPHPFYPFSAAPNPSILQFASFSSIAHKKVQCLLQLNAKDPQSGILHRAREKSRLEPANNPRNLDFLRKAFRLARFKPSLMILSDLDRRREAPKRFTRTHKAHKRSHRQRHRKRKKFFSVALFFLYFREFTKYLNRKPLFSYFPSPRVWLQSSKSRRDNY